MANVYYAQAKCPEALKLHEDVLAIRVTKLGLEHLLTADTYLNIGNVYLAQKKFPETLEMYQKCLEIRTKVLGPDHLDVAMQH